MIKIQDIDLNKIKTSRKKPYSKPNNAYKHYIVYNCNDETIPLLIRLPEMIGRYKVFKDGKTMNFLHIFIKICEEIFEDFSNKIGKEFSTEPTFDNEYGTHIKSKTHENKTRFHNNKTPKKDTNYGCSTLIRIESVYFKSKELKYYPQVFLEQCRYRLDNGGLCTDACDKSDNMPYGEGEFDSKYEFDNDNNESEKPSKRPLKNSD